MSYINNVPSAGGGGSGTVNLVQVLVNFGFEGSTGQEGDIATASVSAPWVTGSSILVCCPQAIATTYHDPDDYAIEGITAYVESIIPGSGFTVIASAPQNTYGTYYISVSGA